MNEIKAKTSMALLIAMLILSAFVGAQFVATVKAAGYTEYIGTVSGVNYVVRIPDPWNGMLVVVTQPGESTPILDARTSSYNTTSAPLLARGYAVAASNYGGAIGYCHSKAVNSTYTVTKYIVDTYHITGKVFLYGNSMGGNFALFLGQKYPELYDGVLDTGGSKDAKSHYAYYDTIANLTVPEIRSYVNASSNVPDAALQSLKNFCVVALTAYQNETGGTPQQVPQAYEDRSNTYHANITIPVITIHSLSDLLVPVSQTTMYQAAVAAAGRSSLYRAYILSPGVNGTAQVPTRLDELLSWSEELHPSLRASAFCNVTVLTGWTWWFFAHSTGGIGSRTYQWYEGSTLLQGQTSMVLPVTKSAPGTYTFYCKVTDAEGTTVNSNNVTLTVR